MSWNTDKELKFINGRRWAMSWNTDKELKFIKGLGTGIFARVSTRVKQRSRAELLQGYLNGAEQRQDWGAIDRSAVIGFAKEELRHCS